MYHMRHHVSKGLRLTGYYYRDIKLRRIAERGGEINETPDMSRAAAKSVALKDRRDQERRRTFLCAFHGW
jgi:hypothetical protein